MVTTAALPLVLGMVMALLARFALPPSSSVLLLVSAALLLFFYWDTPARQSTRGRAGQRLGG